MESTSRQQVDAIRAGDLPPLEEVREHVWSLAQPMPGGHLAYSFTYLVRGADGHVHVIDPGWDSEENWERLVAALEVIAPGGSGVKMVSGITGTHLHPDHVGMAARLRGESGAPLALHATECRALERHDARGADPQEVAARLAAWGVPLNRRQELTGYLDRSPERLALSVDRELSDGEMLPIVGSEIRVLATPGHTGGHICLLDEQRGLLFTGDHVLPTVFSGLGLGGPTGTNPLADFVESIRRVRDHPDREALPGHGYRFRGLADRAQECLDHQLERAREVAAALAEVKADVAEPTVWELAARLTWSAGWAGLQGFQLLSALSQTAMHREYVRDHGVPAR